MHTRIQVVFDAAEPEKLAGFGELAPGYVREPPAEGFESREEFARSAGIPEEQFGEMSARIDPAGAGRLFFQRAPDPADTHLRQNPRPAAGLAHQTSHLHHNIAPSNLSKADISPGS